MTTLENPILETRHMRLVVALVDEGTTARAASRLHLTQSAVSHQLTELERRLGFALFVREKRRLTLTPAGEELLSAARRLLSELARTETALREHAGRTRARVRISTECYTCYHWLPAALAVVQREHDVEAHIVLEVTRQPFTALLAGDLDVAISTKAPSKTVDGVTIFEDELVCAMAPSHPLAKKPIVTADDLRTTHLFTYDVPRDDLSWLKQKLLGDLVPENVTKVPLTEAIIELVRAGMGVSVLARWAIAPQLGERNLVAKSLTRRGVRRTWRALHRKNSPPHVKAFAKAIARAAAAPA